MVAGDFLMQMPPYPFDGVGFRCIGRQKVKLHTMSPPSQVLPHLATTLRLMEDRIVADHMNHPVAPEAPTQFIQMSQEQVGIATLAWLRKDQFPRTPVERPRQIALLVGAWSYHLGLLTAPHPHG